MDCNIKIKESTIQFLKAKDALGDARVVKDSTKFDELNKGLTRLAYEKYNVGDGNMLLFNTEGSYKMNLDGSTRYILRAVPNEELFEILNDAVNNQLDNLPLGKNNTIEDIFSESVPEKLVLEQLQAGEPFSAEKELGTLNEFVLFGNQEGKENYSAVEVLQNILENTTGLDNELKFFIEKLRVLAASTKAKVKIVSKEVLLKNALMQYNSESDTIEVSLDVIRGLSLNKVLHAILHEVTHSVTVNKYNNPQTITQKQFKKFIDETFEEYKGKNISFMAETSIANDFYGFRNPQEFIAESFSNPLFKKHLEMLDNKYDGKSTNWWSKFIDAIRRIFGIKKTKTTDKLLSNIIKVIPTEDIYYTKKEQTIKDLNKDIVVVMFNEEIKGFNTEKEFNIFLKENKKDDFRKLNKKEIERIKSEYNNERYALEKDNPFTELRTLNDKLDYAIDKINENLNYNLASLNRQLQFAKEDKKENLENYIAGLENTQDSIRQLKNSNKLRGIGEFLDRMASSLAYIEDRIKEADYSDKKQLFRLFDTFTNYLNSFSVIEHVNKAIVAAEREDYSEMVDKEEFAEIKKAASYLTGSYTQLQVEMQEAVKQGMREYLNDVKYFKNIETQHYNRLVKEWKQKGIKEDKKAWVIRQMSLPKTKSLIEQDVKEAVDKLMDNPAWDIYGMDVYMGSSINVSSPLINIMNQFMFEIQSEKNKLVSEMNSRIEEAYNNLRKEKSTNNIDELYKNIIEKDENGRPFLKTNISYKFYVEVQEEIKRLGREYHAKKEELIEKLPDDYNSDEYFEIKKELKSLEKEYKKATTKLKEDNVDFDEENNSIIKDKWKNDLTSLTKAEKEFLDLLIEITEFTKYETYGQKNESLVKYSFDAKFYELPKITKSDIERMWGGDVVGMVKDKKDDLTKVRPDDVGYINQATDISGEKINRLKIHYRDTSGKFDYKNQSYDVANLYRLEYENGAIYKIRREAEIQLNSLISIAENKQYHKKEGTSKVRNIFTKKYNLVNGHDTNTVKMMRNMMQNKFYDIMNKSNTKIAGADLNKVVSFINGTSAFLDLSLNLASSTANVLNANAQLFLEGFIKGHFITASGIRKANGIYGKDLPEILKDLTRPNNHSYVNQINEIFDTQGTLRMNNKNYLQTDLLKKGMDTQALQVLHQSGEHWVQGVTTLSVLDGIKVMNANSEFINKSGKVVKTEKAAASLLDMLQKDNDTGKVILNPSVEYTTHSRITKWNEGGKTNVELLLRKKIYDTVGNYTETDQPEIMRHWWGKMLMLYRRYLIPMGQSRLRGVETAFKRKEDLSEDELRYSYALQEFEEGTYTTLIRYAYTAIQDKKYYLLSHENWDNLTDYEKHNIKKAVTELIMTWVVLPLTLKYLAALMGGDDEAAYFFLYQLRRLDTELSQYRSISEGFKMMRSPIPSARLLQNSVGIFQRAFSPWSWDDVYQSGPNKGKSKNWTKFKKTIPVVKEFQRTYEDLFSFQNSTWGTGL